MNDRKKCAGLLLALIMCLSLAACGGSGSNGGSSGGGNGSDEESTTPAFLVDGIAYICWIDDEDGTLYIHSIGTFAKPSEKTDGDEGGLGALLGIWYLEDDDTKYIEVTNASWIIWELNDAGEWYIKDAGRMEVTDAEEGDYEAFSNATGRTSYVYLINDHEALWDAWDLVKTK